MEKLIDWFEKKVVADHPLWMVVPHSIMFALGLLLAFTIGCRLITGAWPSW